MGKEEIVNRIISDAEEEGARIEADAKTRAEGIIAGANAAAAKERAKVEEEVEKRAARIREVNDASVRLESAKILLAEKRRVIGEIYARALQKLLSLGESESLALLNRLLYEYAQEGDEIVLAQNFAFAEGVKKLDSVKELKLTLSASRADISGGCLLIGETSDKDLSYSSLLAADMEENQSAMAAELFK